MAEMSIILTVFFALTYGLVTLSLNLALYGLLSKAALQGINVAIKIKDLDLVDSTNPIEQAAFDVATNSVIQAASDLPGNSGLVPPGVLEVELIFPYTNEHPTCSPANCPVPPPLGDPAPRRTAMRRYPLIVQARAPRLGGGWFGGSLKVTAIGLGYREYGL